MPRVKSDSKVEDVNPDYVRMYYEHQYDRIKKNEDQALTISNIVLTISALIITFGFNNKQSFGSILILFLPMVIIIANIFAILYIADNGRWIFSHRTRAQRILEVYAPKLYKLDKETVASHPKDMVNRRRVQNLIHYLFIFVAAILLVIFTLEIFGVSIV